MSVKAMKIFSGFTRKTEQRFHHVVGVFPLRRGARKLGVVLAFRMLGEQALPDFQASRKMRLPVGVQTQTRGQQQHVGIGAEHRTRRTRAGHFAANRRVEVAIYANDKLKKAAEQKTKQAG